jgi:hypothetical protein
MNGELKRKITMRMWLDGVRRCAEATARESAHVQILSGRRDYALRWSCLRQHTQYGQHPLAGLWVG